MVDVFVRFTNVHWPDAFVALLKALNLSALLGIQVWVGDLLLPFECALALPIHFFTRLLLTLLLPLGISAIVFGVAFLVWRASGRDDDARKALFASPGVFNVHIWALLLLYPSLCRVTLATFSCVPLIAADGTTSYRLFDDPAIECYTDKDSWTGWATVAGVGIAVYCIGAPLSMLWLTYRHRESPEGRARVGMLLVSYTPSCWFFESVEMLRKFLLTSVVLVVAPNTRVQLWFGLVVSVSFAILTSTLRPYRDPLPALVQMLALLQVVFDYASATLFFTDPALVVRGTLQEHSYAAAVGIVLVITNLLAFLVLAASIVLALRAQRRVLREFRLTDADGARLHLEPPAAGAGGFHLFLSHQWKWGQDQAGTLKSALQALLPELRCFLDVDSLKDIGQLEAHVRESDLVLIVLTQGYVESKNCRRELREALEQGKRLLVLRETDANHGAISLDELRLEASLLPLEADKTAANAIARIIEVGDSLEWHREGHLKRVTLAAIVQDLFDLQVAAGGAAAATVRVTCPGGDSPRSSPAAVRVRARLLDAYLVGAPGVHAQVAEALGRAGVEVLGGDGQEEEADEVPLVVVLCPQLLRDATLCEQLSTALLAPPRAVHGHGPPHAQEGDRMAVASERLQQAVRLYSTTEPFDHYLTHCEERCPQLFELGLLRHMYGKWPESAALQDAAAREVAKQLREAAHDGEGGARGQSVSAVMGLGGVRRGGMHFWRQWRWRAATPLLARREVEMQMGSSDGVAAGTGGRADGGGSQSGAADTGVDAGVAQSAKV